MNFKKRFVALCLVTAAALSLVFSASVKSSRHVDEGQVLLCESYDEHPKKIC